MRGGPDVKKNVGAKGEGQGAGTPAVGETAPLIIGRIHRDLFVIDGTHRAEAIRRVLELNAELKERRI
jgi:hypothetical protein